MNKRTTNRVLPQSGTNGRINGHSNGHVARPDSEHRQHGKNAVAASLDWRDGLDDFGDDAGQPGHQHGGAGASHTGIGRIKRHLKPRAADGYSNEAFGAGEDRLPSGDSKVSETVTGGVPPNGSRSDRRKSDSKARKQEEASVRESFAELSEANDLAEADDDDGLAEDDQTEGSDENFLIGSRPKRPGPQDEQVDAGDDDWYKSEAFKTIYRRGSGDLPGNRSLGVSRWMLFYFGDVVLAVVFSQILYWFGPGKNGRPRVRRRDDQGRLVLEKTHRELADEVGLTNERRIEKMLTTFRNTPGEKAGRKRACHKTFELLDFKTCGIGKGRTTRIWLKPGGILNAYRLGCQRAEMIEAKYHDKFGGS